MFQLARIIHQLKEEVRSGTQRSMKSRQEGGSNSCRSMHFPSLLLLACCCCFWRCCFCRCCFCHCCFCNLFLRANAYIFCNDRIDAWQQITSSNGVGCLCDPHSKFCHHQLAAAPAVPPAVSRSLLLRMILLLAVDGGPIRPDQQELVQHAQSGLPSVFQD